MSDLRDKYHMDNNGNFLNESEYKRALENGDIYEAGGRTWDYNNISYDYKGEKY